MNERIRELWAQCVTKHTKTPMNWQNAADEFAELIIEECISIVLKEHDEGIDRHGDYQLACYELYREIKQHFGVSE